MGHKCPSEAGSDIPAEIVIMLTNWMWQQPTKGLFKYQEKNVALHFLNIFSLVCWLSEINQWVKRFLKFFTNNDLPHFFLCIWRRLEVYCTSTHRFSFVETNIFSEKSNGLKWIDPVPISIPQTKNNLLFFRINIWSLQLIDKSPDFINRLYKIEIGCISN